ncbi:MAG: arginyltransferase [Rhodospirillaceae bacterium]|nr:arginyltransferase [Rhodospirillaceae bacterium]
MRDDLHIQPRFYYSAPAPCPYLQTRTERRIFTELTGAGAGARYDLLSQAGFRRSQDFAYRPACPGCRACVPVRVVVKGFAKATTGRGGRSWRRILAMNSDLKVSSRQAKATEEQYRLFSIYQNTRHGGEMAEMDFAAFASMIETSPVHTQIVEFRDGDGSLVAGCLIDRLGDGLSAVYSFFDPTQDRRGLGNFMILWLINRCSGLHLPFVYLGYWIAGSSKMSYKARFRPLEALGPEGWRSLAPAPVQAG